MSQVNADSKIVEEFKSRRKKQFIAIIPVVIGMIFIVLAEEGGSLYGIDQIYSLIIGGVIVLSCLVFSFMNWRCPKCNTYLGKKISPAFCSSCGEKLRDNV